MQGGMAEIRGNAKQLLVDQNKADRRSSFKTLNSERAEQARLGKEEHHPARHLPLSQSIHDQIHIAQRMCSDLTVNFSLAG